MSALPRSKWRRCAERLAERIGRDRLHPTVRAWADAAPAGRWTVGFSGGTDSLALVLLLWAHWPERRRDLRVVHFNHRLRGAASGQDQRFCARVCRDLGLRFKAASWSAAPTEPSEGAARAARHAFFREEMRRGRSTSLWLGHQMDDIAETFLMRLARGSGAAGLAAPRPVHMMSDGRVHLRPLLALAKTELIHGLRAVGADWREDATNASGAHLRNRIRREVLPAWCRASGDRDALAGAALSRELLEEDDVALDAWVRELRPFRSDGALSLRRLAGKPRAVWRRVLRAWLGGVVGGGTLSRAGFTALLHDLEAGRFTQHSVGSNGFAKITKTKLMFVQARRKGTK